MIDPATLEQIPESYQAIQQYFTQSGDTPPFDLRLETFRRIEKLTGRPLIAYIARTHNAPHGVPSYIDDSDLTGFSDLAYSTQGNAIDVLLISNGGSAEATERIVRLVRSRFADVRYIVPANAFSAATLMCFSGDGIIMDAISTLGPIDPQFNGIPARAIRRAFEELEKRLKEEGPRALTAYLPLINKYDLHMLEICKSAEELSKELARTWLSTYMLKRSEDDSAVSAIVEFFANYDTHKSHGRSIDRDKARQLGLSVTFVEEVDGLSTLVRSINNQYECWFDRTPFYKMFENARGVGWGRQTQSLTMQLPILPAGPVPVPQPGPPQRSG